jgi:hypothetical protein
MRGRTLLARCAANAEDITRGMRWSSPARMVPAAVVGFNLWIPPHLREQPPRRALTLVRAVGVAFPSRPSTTAPIDERAQPLNPLVQRATMSSVRSVLCICVVAAVALVGPSVAGANIDPISDGDDTRGRLDIQAVTTPVFQGGNNLANAVHTISTYGRWRPRELSGANAIEIFYNTDGDRRWERIAVAFFAGGRLRGALLNGSGRFLSEADVERPNRRSLTIGLSPGQLGKPAGYRWAAFSFFKNATACAKVCVDRAPDQGRVLHDIKPPRISFVGATKSLPLGVPLLAIPATTDFEVPFNITEGGGSGLASWELSEKVEPDGSWTSVATGSASSNSVPRSGSEGSAFTYEVVAKDGDNNDSTRLAVMAVPFDDGYLGGDGTNTNPSLEYGGTWGTAGATSDDFLDTLHTAGMGGGTLQFPFWGYIALVGPATCGTASANVNGTIDNVQAPCDGARRVILFEDDRNGSSWLTLTAQVGFAVDGIAYVPD